MGGFRKEDKGVRELKKLTWDMNDGKAGEVEDRLKRFGRASMKVNL